MTFSIIVPLYNKAKSVRTTIDSILSQSVSSFELIVIDDGSTDGSGEEVSQFDDGRLTLITQKNAGVSAARNRGVQESNHPFIIFIDADDS